MTQTETLKPLKTWSHLAGQRRKPSEYEIVSTNLHYTTDNPDAPFELDPNFGLATWFKTYRNASPLQHPDWNAFRDPDEIVYRTYNLLQDGQETYLYGLLSQFSERGQDQMLDPSWANSLARLYTPSRYPFHAIQMMSAYLCQIAPASTISNCATYQAADSLRWLTHTAYRTRELARAFPTKGFSSDELGYWEKDEAWQGIRELVEKAMVAWDWGECFVALNLIVKPVLEETVIRSMGEAGRRHGDTLLGMLCDAQLADAARHRRWVKALVQMSLTSPGNRDVLKQWLDKWMPLADNAIATYCKWIPENPDAGDRCQSALRDFHHSVGL
jgi:toluene monooxygenase system protein E